MQRELDSARDREGRLLIVTMGYSRAVRSVIKKTLPNKDGFDLFFLGGGEGVSDFGTRLLKHQITDEQYYNEDACGSPINKAQGLKGRVVYGDKEALAQLLDQRNVDKDRLLVFLGCDRLDDGVYDEIAYLNISPDYINGLFSNVSHYDVWIFAGRYKKGICYWERLLESQCAEDEILLGCLSDYIKSRVEPNINLYRWRNSNTNGELKIYSQSDVNPE